jgi:hypothetical protein
MNRLIERFSDVVKGSISGFDRIVFKGCILPLMSASEVMKFCGSKGVLNKDYKSWVMAQTKKIVDAAHEYSQKHTNSAIIHLASWKIRKEELARKRQQDTGITSGLIGIWSCLETGWSYRAHFCGKTGYPILRPYQAQFKHLYFYFDDPQFGFMNIRLQTWFPYHIQICLNGREWLRRSLERQKIDFVAQGNKFLAIADYERAQQFLDKQRHTRFPEVLSGFLPVVFPAMKEILGPHLSYYWTMWQSEWATDLVFSSPGELSQVMDTLLRHAHITGTSTRVLRYLDRPLTKEGTPYKRSAEQIVTRMTDFNEGVRVRHWCSRNSVKVYNQQNILRIETTINDPAQFKVFRHKQGQDKNEPKQRLVMRKGVADCAQRAVISQDINNRFADNLALLQDHTPARNSFDEVVRHIRKKGKRYRALDPTGKDRELLLAISDPAYCVAGLTNSELREKLAGSPFLGTRTQKQSSAKISRHLRLLREHGLIKKLPRQNRYQVTLKGVRLTTLLNVILDASIENLMKIAA